MDYFISNGYHGIQLAAINRCRLYLQVINLSDITIGEGKRIQYTSYHRICNTIMKTEYEWLVQKIHGRLDWIEWRREIDSVFYVSVPFLLLPSNYQLKNWDEDIPTSRWNWWYYEIKYIIYQSLISTLSWKYTTQHQQRRRYNRIYLCETISHYSYDTIRQCTVNKHRSFSNGINFTGVCVLGPIKLLLSPTFLLFLHSVCTSEKWAYQNITLSDYLPSIVSVFKHGSLRALCDRSFNNGYGTSAWYLEGNCWNMKSSSNITSRRKK